MELMNPLLIRTVTFIKSVTDRKLLFFPQLSHPEIPHVLPGEPNSSAVSIVMEMELVPQDQIFTLPKKSVAEQEQAFSLL